MFMKIISFALLIAGCCFTGYVTRASIPGMVSSKAGDSTVTTGTGAKARLDDVMVQDALREFKSLSRMERKTRLKEVKTALKEYKAQKKASDDVSTNTLLLTILAILLPPLAVYLHEGTINGKFWLSLLLTLLFFLPGVIYALIVVLG